MFCCNQQAREVPENSKTTAEDSKRIFASLYLSQIDKRGGADQEWIDSQEQGVELTTDCVSTSHPRLRHRSFIMLLS